MKILSICFSFLFLFPSSSCRTQVSKGNNKKRIKMLFFLLLLLLLSFLSSNLITNMPVEYAKTRGGIVVSVNCFIGLRDLFIVQTQDFDSF